MLEISSTPNQSLFILHLSGRLETASYKQFEDIALSAINNGYTQFVIDLEKLDYISSAGFRILLLITHKLIDLNGNLTVCNLSPTISYVFELSGFNKIISQSHSLEETIAKLTKQL